MDNLAARLSAEEAAGDGAAMAQTIKEMEEIAEGRNELVKSQPLCQLRVMVSTFGTLVLTVNQGLLCESLGHLGVKVAACDACWLEVLMALGTFSRPDSIAKDEFLAQAVQTLASDRVMSLCDACRAQGACEVDVVLEHAAKALVLSLAWYSTDQEGDDVAALLELVWRDARLPAKRVFSSIGKVKFEVDLFAVAVFQNAHYTAFVRARDGSDSWTYHDRRSAVAVGSFANVVKQCRDGPMLPYLLFYDSLTTAPGA